MNQPVQTDVVDEEIDAKKTETTTTDEVVEKTETTKDAPPETSEATEKPKQSRSQNSKQRLRRRLAEEASRNQELVEKISTLESKVDSVINPPSPRPSRVDFETEEDYEDAVFDWRTPKTESDITAEKPAPQANKVPKLPEEIQENWDNQLDHGHEKYEDFDEVVFSIPAQHMTDAMTNSIIESKNGAEVAYFLGENLKEAERISKLSFIGQIKEIEKLGNKFTTSTSQAPEPIAPAKGDVSAGQNPEDMSPEEYRQYRREQKIARRG